MSGGRMSRRGLRGRLAAASMALSREPEFATRSPEVTARAHAAVAARHVRNASSLRPRSVLRDVEMALDVERVMDGGMNGQEPLG